MKKIVTQFLTANETGKIYPFKIGHVNDSFIIDAKTKGGESYFLQKINHHIFRNVEGLQDNIRFVTDHQEQNLLSLGKVILSENHFGLSPLKQVDGIIRMLKVRFGECM